MTLPTHMMPEESKEAAATQIVHVVDDEPSVCRVFERVGALIGIETTSYSTAEAFLGAYDPDRPGCLILDLHLPTMSGLELLDEISKRGWQLPIIIMSGKAAVSHAVAAFKAGSIDFLEKPFGTKEIEAAMRHALEVDQRTREEDAKKSKQEARRSVIQERIDRLTPRERQVMDLVVAGKSNRIIAGELGVSPKTIEVHRANVMQKMQAESLAELVKMAIAARDDETGEA
jgi:RNA polymerase sigma factor (sigma-70 family)